jgi:hypothetical protein
MAAFRQVRDSLREEVFNVLESAAQVPATGEFHAP